MEVDSFILLPFVDEKLPIFGENVCLRSQPRATLPVRILDVEVRKGHLGVGIGNLHLHMKALTVPPVALDGILPVVCRCTELQVVKSPTEAERRIVARKFKWFYHAPILT